MVSDTITSFVNNINELSVNNILQSCDTLYLADTHLNVYIYSRRQLVFLENVQKELNSDFSIFASTNV